MKVNHNGDKNDRNKKKTREGIPKVQNRGINCDIPGGKVAGDRLFVRDEKTGKKVYCDIVRDQYGV